MRIWKPIVFAFSLLICSGASAQVVDGDTFKLKGEMIRLVGIDAPELRQRCVNDGELYYCGLASKAALDGLISGLVVTCYTKHKDRYGRNLSVCFVNGRELNAEMVRLGWAIAYRKYSNVYVEQEDEARKARRGIWKGGFVAPWVWRKRMRERGS